MTENVTGAALRRRVAARAPGGDHLLPSPSRGRIRGRIGRPSLRIEQAPQIGRSQLEHRKPGGTIRMPVTDRGACFRATGPVIGGSVMSESYPVVEKVRQLGWEWRLERMAFSRPGMDEVELGRVEKHSSQRDRTVSAAE